MFSTFSQQLDDKHDRYERITKISRDITIEAKRIIFLLHTIDPRKENKEKVLAEANERLKKLCSTQFKSIGKELEGRDQFEYLRAFTFGLQEFIEAYTYMNYMKDGEVADWNEIRENFKYEEENGAKGACILPPTDYILGIGDLTGEIMRHCISSLGNGDFEACKRAGQFLQQVHTGFISAGPVHHRDYSQKEWTLKQSLLKCENVCYNIRLRGSEANFVNAPATDEDEGFVQ